jgi:hypothetical protein
VRPTLALALLAALSACRDPGDTADSRAPAFPVESVAARLHETIPSLIYVAWEQLEAAPVAVEYSADGATWLRSPTVQRGAGPHEELLLGLPYGVEARYRVVIEPGEGERRGEDAGITTGEQPAGVPDLAVHYADPEAWDPSLRYVLASIDEQSEAGISVGSWTFVFDRDGRVVWAWETPATRATLHPRVSWDGADLLVDYNSYYMAFDGGAESEVVRLKIDGSEVARHATPGLHHPFTDTPDGTLYWGANDRGWDVLTRLAPGGEPERLWACADHYDAIGYSDHPGYCASNTVTWDEPTGRVLYSFYSSDTVLEIDPEGGEVLRSFGHLPGSWGFEPEESAFWWQHGAHYTPEGTLLLSTRSAEDGEETVAREYRLDEASERLEELRSFGLGEGVYGSVLGEAHRLPSGNTLHNYGSGARLREFDPEGRVVWDLSFSSGTYLGRTTPIEDLYALAP